MTLACLDSWAVIAWLQGEEPACTEVAAAIADRPPVISWINLAEVHYSLRRRYGADKAVEYTNALRDEFDVELPTERRILEAAIFKADHPIAFADCFAISTARDNDAVLFTGDPEILELGDLPCEVRDLRG